MARLGHSHPRFLAECWCWRWFEELCRRYFHAVWLLHYPKENMGSRQKEGSWLDLRHIWTSPNIWEISEDLGQKSSLTVDILDSHIHCAEQFRMPKENNGAKVRIAPWYISKHFLENNIVHTLKWMMRVWLIWMDWKSSNRLRDPGTRDGGALNGLNWRHKTACV